METKNIELFNYEDLAKNYWTLNQLLFICDKCDVPGYFASLAMLILESRKSTRLENFAKARDLIINFHAEQSVKGGFVCETKLQEFSAMVFYYLKNTDRMLLETVKRALFSVYHHSYGGSIIDVSRTQKTEDAIYSFHFMLMDIEDREGARFGLFASNMVENVNIVLDLTKYKGGRRWDLRENKQN